MKEFIDKLISRLKGREKYYHECALDEIMENGHTLNAEGFLGKEDAYGDAISSVNELAAEYRQDLDEVSQGWIPCSINKHKEIHVAKKMWVTMRNKDSKYCFVRRLMWNGCLRRWEWDNGKPISDMWEVVAWKKIDVPAPYTEGE